MNLTRIHGVTAATLKTLSTRLPNLRELYLYADAEIDDSGFTALSSTESVITKLTTLDLCGCQLISDNNVINICIKNPHLRYLNLTWCLRLTDRAISEGICGQTEQGPNLKDGLTLLSLFGNTLITNLTVDSLANSSSKLTLKTLDLNGCKRIDDAARAESTLKEMFPKC